MNLIVFGIILPWLLLGVFAALGAWIAFQIIHQNGRLLSRLETLEPRQPPPLPEPLPAAAASPPAAREVDPALALPDPIYGRLLLRLEALEQRLGGAEAPAPGSPAGLPIGAAAPEFELPDLEGRRRALADFRGRPLLLIFFNPGCGFCIRMAADLAALPAGTPAPNFRLPLLYGGELALADYRGRPVLLVFSDPHCGPCQALAPPLEAAARRTPGVQVVMVSRGDPESNRAKAAEHGLTFPVVLQRQWEISREYGMFATPVAYLIDAEGVLASEVTVGVEPILALLARAAAAPTDPSARCRCGKPFGECRCGERKTKAAGGRARASGGRSGR